MLILLNVIYFKGLWLQQFDKAETSSRVFRLSNEGKKQIPMMHRSGIYKYYEDNCFQTISLPYPDDKLSMIIFLPRENAITSTIFRRVLKTKNYGDWTSRYRMLKELLVYHELELNTKQIFVRL